MGRLLTFEDVSGVEDNPRVSTFEFLIQISKVAHNVLEKEKLILEEKLVPEKNVTSTLDISKGTERLVKEKYLKRKHVCYNPKDHDYILSKKEKRLKRPIIIEEEKPKKKSPERRQREKATATIIKKKEKCSSTKVIDTGPNPPPGLPPDFEKKIKELNGSEEKLLIQKRLTKTDVNPGQNRLSMPVMKVREKFLRREEKTCFDKQTGKDHVPEIRVKLIEPSCQECDITFKMWIMRKRVGKEPSKLYVFITEWNSIHKNNGLKEDMVVQVWSFRRQDDDQLCFALVKVEEEDSRKIM